MEGDLPPRCKHTMEHRPALEGKTTVTRLCTDIASEISRSLKDNTVRVHLQEAPRAVGFRGRK